MPGQYIVQQGDTFWSIANGIAGMSVDDLLKANPSVNPKTLQVGQAINTLKHQPVQTIVVLASSLHTYKTANWNDKSGPIVKKNEVFTVNRELTVSGSKMYQLKSGLYITANPKYVKLRKG
ncbi:MAG: LysM peptidoglycan-binding domain-containing protein [Bacillota bacterium]